MPRASNRTRNRINEHVLERAFERWGLYLSAQEIRELSLQITHARSIFINAISHTRVQHIVVYKGTEIPVIYNKINKCIETIQTPEDLASWKRSYNYVKHTKAARKLLQEEEAGDSGMVGPPL